MIRTPSPGMKKQNQIRVVHLCVWGRKRYSRNTHYRTHTVYLNDFLPTEVPLQCGHEDLLQSTSSLGRTFLTHTTVLTAPWGTIGLLPDNTGKPPLSLDVDSRQLYPRLVLCNQFRYGRLINGERFTYLSH